MANKQEFVFISGEPFSGIGKQSGKPFTLRKINFVDPITYENHQLDFKEGLNLSYLSKGEKVFIESIFEAPRFGNNDSKSVVVNVIPVASVGLVKS
jgi:hypothetical protein